MLQVLSRRVFILFPLFSIKRCFALSFDVIYYWSGGLVGLYSVIEAFPGCLQIYYS